jgi:hypothetical protein
MRSSLRNSPILASCRAELVAVCHDRRKYRRALNGQKGIDGHGIVSARQAIKFVVFLQLYLVNFRCGYATKTGA